MSKQLNNVLVGGLKADLGSHSKFCTTRSGLPIIRRSGLLPEYTTRERTAAQLSRTRAAYDLTPRRWHPGTTRSQPRIHGREGPYQGQRTQSSAFVARPVLARRESCCRPRRLSWPAGGGDAALLRSRGRGSHGRNTSHRSFRLLTSTSMLNIFVSESARLLAALLGTSLGESPG